MRPEAIVYGVRNAANLFDAQQLISKAIRRAKESAFVGGLAVGILLGGAAAIGGLLLANIA